MSYVASAVTATLIAIALLHVFWASGGRWGSQNAVPEIDGRPAFKPGKTATWIVAALLGSAALCAARRSRRQRASDTST
jgi:hypothetical protein